MGDVVIMNDQGDVGPRLQDCHGVRGGQGEGGAGRPDRDHAQGEAESLQGEAQEAGGGQGQLPQQHRVQSEHHKDIVRQSVLQIAAVPPGTRQQLGGRHSHIVLCAAIMVVQVAGIDSLMTSSTEGLQLLFMIIDSAKTTEKSKLKTQS